MSAPHPTSPTKPGQIFKFVPRACGPAARRRTAQRQLAGGSARSQLDVPDRARSLEGNRNIARGCCAAVTPGYGLPRLDLNPVGVPSGMSLDMPPEIRPPRLSAIPSGLRFMWAESPGVATPGGNLRPDSASVLGKCRINANDDPRIDRWSQPRREIRQGTMFRAGARVYGAHVTSPRIQNGGWRRTRDFVVPCGR